MTADPGTPIFDKLSCEQHEPEFPSKGSPLLRLALVFGWVLAAVLLFSLAVNVAVQHWATGAELGGLLALNGGVLWWGEAELAKQEQS